VALAVMLARSPWLASGPLAAALVATAVGGCTEPAPRLGDAQLASTVADHETTSCSTGVVLELSRQVAHQVGCAGPGVLVPFAEGMGIEFSGTAVLPYVASAARDDLVAAVASAGGTTLSVNSAYRTVVQQYLLYRWYQLGRCGITAAAAPGNSNHESGRAIDVGNYGDWTAILAGFGWNQTVPGDPVHFDHVASPDIRGTDVRAFQELWNLNHPDDPIAEDGVYGAITESRLRQAPAEGFAEGPDCAPFGLDVAVDLLDGPRRLRPGQRATIALRLRNVGSTTWPAGTRLVTAEPAGRVSALHDPDSWPAPDVALVLADPVDPGGVVPLTFEVIAPPADAAVELTESFALDGAGLRFGAIALVVVVDPDAVDGGGCDAGGGGASGLLGLLVAGLVRRRGARGAPVRAA